MKSIYLRFKGGNVYTTGLFFYCRAKSTAVFRNQRSNTESNLSLNEEKSCRLLCPAPSMGMNSSPGFSIDFSRDALLYGIVQSAVPWKIVTGAVTCGRWE